MNENDSWFGFDDLFWLTLLFLFVATLVGVLIRRFRRDRCLKLFEDFHITLIHADGSVLWGDVLTSSQGIEICYDAPFVTSRGLTKASHLVFEDELSECLALCRTLRGLTDDERIERRKQIQRTFNPGIISVVRRRLRNCVDMLRDAIGKSLGLVMGSLGGRLGKVMTNRKSEVGDLSNTLVGVAANAFEPLLERYIGRDVIMECNVAPGASEATTEVSGYLVEYTEKYIALFSTEQQSIEELDLTITESQQGEYFDLERLDDRLVIRCKGPDVLIVRNIQTGDTRIDLDMSLFPGCEHTVRINSPEPLQIRLDRTSQIDLICPRSNARVRFGSVISSADGRGRGISPEK